MARAADLLGMERRQAEMFRDLQRGEFVALGPALSKRPLPVRIGPVETSGRSGSPVLMPLPAQPPENAAEMIFASAGAPEEPARQPQRPRAPAGDVLVQLASYRPPAPAEQDPGLPPAERQAAMEE